MQCWKKVNDANQTQTNAKALKIKKKQKQQKWISFKIKTFIENASKRRTITQIKNHWKCVKTQTNSKVKENQSYRWGMNSLRPKSWKNAWTCHIVALAMRLPSLIFPSPLPLSPLFASLLPISSHESEQASAPHTRDVLLAWSHQTSPRRCRRHD